LLLAALVAVGTSVSVAAQPPDAPAPAPDDDHTGNELMRQSRYIEQFRMLKLMETLELREDQEEEFISKFFARRRDQRALRHARERLFDQLHNGLVKDSLTNDQIMTMVADIQQIREQEFQSQKAFLADVKSILTPEQYGKLVVFQERFEYELLRTIDRFRRGPAPGAMPVGGRGKKGMGRDRGDRQLR
jgi:Spy/CpxP family protein refolding chaperone